MSQKLSILIPVYNEESTIHLILNAINEVQLIQGIEKEIIIVNDCSQDSTEDKILEYQKNNNNVNLKLFNHEKNKGKGAAIHLCIIKASGDFIVIQDADMEYDPQEYNKLLEPIINGFADVVYGSRFVGGNPHRILFFWHTLGNKFLTFLSNMFTNLNLSDMETCYKMFKKDFIKDIKLKEKRFGFEPEITAKISRIPNIRLYEVGISYYGRTYEEGKKLDGKMGFMLFTVLSNIIFLNNA